MMWVIEIYAPVAVGLAFFFAAYSLGLIISAFFSDVAKSLGDDKPNE